MTDDCLVIVMEYASGGPLQDRIKTSGRLTEAEAKRFFGQLVDGISYCHSQVRSLPHALVPTRLQKPPGITARLWYFDDLVCRGAAVQRLRGAA